MLVYILIVILNNNDIVITDLKKSLLFDYKKNIKSFVIILTSF